MDEEKRKSDTIMPADLQGMLNDRQLRALPGIKCLGWEPQFFRKPVFNAPTLVLRNSKDGRLERQDGLKLREDENEVPPARNLQYF
jgi:hypothetical protein